MSFSRFLSCFLAVVSFCSLNPPTAFSGVDGDKDKQTPLACSASHPKSDNQRENLTDTTQNALALGSAGESFPFMRLPSEILEHVLLLACEDTRCWGPFKKDWLNLRLVCKAFNTTMVNSPAICSKVLRSLDNVQRVQDFLTSPFFGGHARARLSRWALDRLSMPENHATLQALKEEMRQNPHRFRVFVNEPTEAECKRISDFSCHISLKCDQASVLASLDIIGKASVRELMFFDCNDLQNFSVEAYPNLKSLVIHREMAWMSCV